MFRRFWENVWNMYGVWEMLWGHLGSFGGCVSSRFWRGETIQSRVNETYLRTIEDPPTAQVLFFSKGLLASGM